MPEGLSDYEEINEIPTVPAREKSVQITPDQYKNIFNLMTQPVSSEAKPADETASKPTPSQE